MYNITLPVYVLYPGLGFLREAARSNVLLMFVFLTAEREEKEEEEGLFSPVGRHVFEGVRTADTKQT